MAGRKVFTSGEILTAADVNSFLMDQSVMVFADSTARSSAIPSPSEGMVTYLKDDDAVTVYDGSAFRPVGGLVEVKSAIITTPQTFSSVAAKADVAVTGLSITHEVADASNKLIISAFFGVAGSSSTFTNIGLAIHDGTGLIAVGTSVGTNRVAVTAGGRGSSSSNSAVTMPSVTFVHTPGAGSKTYTVRAVNVDVGTRSLFVNRTNDDVDTSFIARGVSSIVIQEVAV